MSRAGVCAVLAFDVYAQDGVCAASGALTIFIWLGLRIRLTAAPVVRYAGFMRYPEGGGLDAGERAWREQGAGDRRPRPALLT